jgi:hypothetical protein
LTLVALAFSLKIGAPAALGFQLQTNHKQMVSPITFLGHAYHPAFFSEKPNAMWEFTTANETVNNWTTLLTVIDRPDARTHPDLDHLAQGVLENYQSHGGRVLLAKTMVDASGAPFNYMVVGFNEPAEHRYELDFVKTALGQKNAYVMIYGVRVKDAQDYTTKAKAYLDQHSSEIGRELEKMAAPPTSTLPRQAF